MRDHIDCINCCKLPEFAKDQLMNGFTKKMESAALKKYKLHNVKNNNFIFNIILY